MKKIEELQIEVIRFEGCEDVIATSTPLNYNKNLNGEWI